MRVFVDIKKCYSLQEAHDSDGRVAQSESLGFIEDAVIVEDQGLIRWLGSRSEFEASRQALGVSSNTEIVSLSGTNILPAFTECHTHLVFAGDRSDEFEMRNQGVSYQEIAKRGGGILSTVNATRGASAEDLRALAQSRVAEFVKQGVTALEVKSGYGLSHEDEIKMLKVARSLKGPKVVTTYLGPHSVPAERSKSEYMQEIMNKTLPEVAKTRLADRADIFIEEGFFDPDDGRAYFQKAQELGLQITAHVEQLSDQGGAVLAAEFEALSVDHLVELGPEHIRQLGESKAPVCVLLPTADFYLKMAYPKARDLLDAGATVALATDFNPGSSPTQSLNFVGVLARLLMKMSLSEVVTAYTYGSAKALGLQADRGSLTVGKVCDFICFETEIENLFYQVGFHPVRSVYREGELLWNDKNKTV